MVYPKFYLFTMFLSTKFKCDNLKSIHYFNLLGCFKPGLLDNWYCIHGEIVLALTLMIINQCWYTTTICLSLKWIDIFSFECTHTDGWI